MIGGLYRIVAMETTTAVGGHHFDNAVVDLLLSDFQRWLYLGHYVCCFSVGILIIGSGRRTLGEIVVLCTS